MRPIFTASLILLGVQLWAARADALSCAREFVRVISPAVDEEVPTNALILIQTFDMNGANRKVRAGLRRKGGGAVGARRTAVCEREVCVITLAPRRPLAPKTAYEVWWGKRSNRRTKPFTTAAGRDSVPPVLGKLRGELVDGEIFDGWNQKKKDVRYLRLHFDRARDPDRKAYQPILALWASTSAPIDFKTRPRLYVSAFPLQPVNLGPSPSPCPFDNFALPPKNRGKLHVGVRAVDLAGNLGQPVTIVIDLERPSPK